MSIYLHYWQGIGLAQELRDYSQSLFLRMIVRIELYPVRAAILVSYVQ